jgi:hypothetical protein
MCTHIFVKGPTRADKVMAVEVKHEFDKEKYVDEHLRRMDLICAYPPMVVEGKQLLGAVAGLLPQHSALRIRCGVLCTRINRRERGPHPAARRLQTGNVVRGDGGIRR